MTGNGGQLAYNLGELSDDFMGIIPSLRQASKSQTPLRDLAMYYGLI